MTIMGFYNMIGKMLPLSRLNKEEVMYAFKYFDEDEDDLISYD